MDVDERQAEGGQGVVEVLFPGELDRFAAHVGLGDVQVSDAG